MALAKRTIDTYMRQKILTIIFQPCSIDCDVNKSGSEIKSPPSVQEVMRSNLRWRDNSQCLLCFLSNQIGHSQDVLFLYFTINVIFRSDIKKNNKFIWCLYIFLIVTMSVDKLIRETQQQQKHFILMGCLLLMMMLWARAKQ